MSCETIEPELIGYQFATLSPEVRVRVEAHLAACPACLQSYFALKRALETEPDALPRPSSAARARLRSAVATQIAQRNAPAPWRWWERPFAFTTAAAVAFSAMVGTFTIATAEPSAPLSIARRAAAADRPLLALRTTKPVPG